MSRICLVVVIIFSAAGGTACSRNSLDIRHDVEYSRRGTRSEARHGQLYIENIKVPDYFTEVVAGSQQFIFLSRRNVWGDDGYFPADEPVSLPSDAERVGDVEIEQGWYTGMSRKRGTPDVWIFVRWEGGAAFVIPTAMESLIEAKNLPRLVRQHRLDLPEF